MKIIITGPTGLVGNSVLTQAIAHPHITSIVAITRRPLPSTITTSPKVTQLILTDADFISYPASALEAFKGATACIWCLGFVQFPGTKEARRISIDYNIAAGEAFAEVGRENGVRFKMVYVSGELVERDQSKSLWLIPESRRIRGLGETTIVELAEKHKEQLEVLVVRPALIYTKGVLGSVLGAVGKSVRVEELSRVLLDTVLNGSKEQFVGMKIINERIAALSKA